jgi:hypothetical protein
MLRTLVEYSQALTGARYRGQDWFKLDDARRHKADRGDDLRVVQR